MKPKAGGGCRGCTIKRKGGRAGAWGEGSVQNRSGKDGERRISKNKAPRTSRRSRAAGGSPKYGEETGPRATARSGRLLRGGRDEWRRGPKGADKRGRQARRPASQGEARGWRDKVMVPRRGSTVITSVKNKGEKERQKGGEEKKAQNKTCRGRRRRRKEG